MKLKFSEVARYAEENPSSIREIMGIVTEYRKHPEKFPRKLIYLGGGWPQDPPPAGLRETAVELLSNVNSFNTSARYGTTRGEPEVLQAIIEYERRLLGRSIEEDYLIFGLGSSDLIGAFMLACLDKGSEVILTSPGYLNYRRQLEIEGLLSFSIKYWPILEESKFKPDVEKLKELITDKTRMIIITTPGNPDGQVYDDETLNAVSDIAEDHGVWLMIDVAYRFFLFTDYPKYFSRPVRDHEIWVCTFSKELRIPGWRAAYAVAHPELIKMVNNIQQGRVLCPSRLVEEILAKYLSREETYKELKEFYADGVKKYKRAAEFSEQLLKEIPGIKPLTPMGGFYVFFDITAYSNDSKKTCKELLDQWQVALAPGVDFALDGWIRLSYAPTVEDLNVVKEGIERMKKYFESLKK